MVENLEKKYEHKRDPLSNFNQWCKNISFKEGLMCADIQYLNFLSQKPQI